PYTTLFRSACRSGCRPGSRAGVACRSAWVDSTISSVHSARPSASPSAPRPEPQGARRRPTTSCDAHRRRSPSAGATQDRRAAARSEQDEAAERRATEAYAVVRRRERAGGQRRHATLIGAALLALAQPRPHVRINEDVRTLAAEHAQHLADDLDTHLAIGLAGDTGHVTRHGDVGEIQDRVVERRRLLLEYVDASGTELATRERFEHGALVLHAAARGVDVDGAVLHE